MTVLSLKNITKSYGSGRVLHDLSLEVSEGEFVAVTGPSGSGKSTLLNIIGLIDQSDSGDVQIFDRKNPSPSSRASRMLRQKSIGYIFQDFGLIPDKSVEYNIKLVLPVPYEKQINDKISKVLSAFDLHDYEKKLAAQCSGGEQQRIALCRLLLKPCSLILADEPTGSLDEKNAQRIGRLFQMMASKVKTIIMVTHDPKMAAMADRVLRLEDLDSREKPVQ